MVYEALLAPLTPNNIIQCLQAHNTCKDFVKYLAKQHLVECLGIFLFCFWKILQILKCIFIRRSNKKVLLIGLQLMLKSQFTC